MVFVPGSIANQQKKPEQKTGGFVPGSVASKVKPATTTKTGFISGSIAGKGAVNNKMLKTSDGLYEVAVAKGLQKEADRIFAAQEGERSKSYLSGGTISDVFDILNTTSYASSGFFKGLIPGVKAKTFTEGVQSRASFTDQDALGKYGWMGAVGGLALDIALDPLTYISFGAIPGVKLAGKGVKALTIGKDTTKVIDTGVGGAAKTFQTLEGGTKVGRYLTSKLAYTLGKDPIFLSTFERSAKNTAFTTEKVIDYGKQVADFSKVAPDVGKLLLKTVDDQGRFGRESLEVLAKKLKPEQLAPVAKLYNMIDSLGKEAVDLGLLSKDKYEQNIGEYIKNAYMEFEQKTGSKLPFGWAKTGVKGIKNRADALSETRKADRIDNPAYLLMKSAIDLARDVENAKLFKAVDEKFGTTVAQEGFTQMPKTARVGALAGKFVPNHMAEYLNTVIPKDPSLMGDLQKSIVGNFKFFKVVMNPGTHARNIISNKVLNYWKLGMNPLDPRTIKAEATAIKEIAQKGGKYTDEAKPLGYNLDTFAAAELKGLLDSVEVASGMKGLGTKWKAVKKTLGDIYQAEENQAKLSAYIYQRTAKKMEPEEAWKAAESATFNYAQVTPFIRKLRESIFGFPFITFTYKATPLAIETAIKHPNRISVIGKIKQSIESQADIEQTDRERANEPSWVKDGFYIKIPGEDALGRSRYFDLTYILPFGDLVSGSFFERAQNMETGTPEGAPIAIAKKSPFIQTVMEIGKNRDFYGNSIWKESDPSEKQMMDLFRHLIKTYSPPPVADLLPAGYNDKGERQYKGFVDAAKASEENQKRNVIQEVMRNFGIKIQPVDADIQETYTEWNKKKGLETLLRERGVVNTMDINYIPKENDN